jgi:hypothetical protein
MSTDISPKWTCLAPSKAACAWPDCGCDPEATKVIAALVEQGWQAPKEVEAILARSSERCDAGWQSIETAPRDGTKIWACEDDVQYECWWRDSRGEAYWMDRVDSEPEPTHWRPLPALPIVVSGSTESSNGRPSKVV